MQELFSNERKIPNNIILARILKNSSLRQAHDVDVKRKSQSWENNLNVFGTDYETEILQSELQKIFFSILTKQLLKLKTGEKRSLFGNYFGQNPILNDELERQK